MSLALQMMPHAHVFGTIAHVFLGIHLALIGSQVSNGDITILVYLSTLDIINPSTQES